MGAEARLQYSNDVRSARASVSAAAKRGALQSLSDCELNLREHGHDLSPCPATSSEGVVRFGGEPIRVDAKLVRTSSLTASIELHGQEEKFHAWVWGNAIQVDDD